MLTDNDFNFLNLGFKKDLESLLNKYCIENDFGVSDWQIASCVIQYLLSLKLFVQSFEEE